MSRAAGFRDPGWLGMVLRRRAPAPPAGATSIYDARSIPVVANLDPVPTWPDTGPEALTMTAGPNVPLYVAAGSYDGGPCVAYGDAGVARYHEAAAVAAIDDNAPMTVGMVFRPMVSTSAGYIFAGVAASRRHDIYLAGTRRLNIIAGTPSYPSAVLFAAFPGPWMYAVCVFRGTTSAMYTMLEDGTANVTSGGSSLMQSNGWRVGAPYPTPPAANTRFIGYIAETRVYRGVDVGPALVAYYRTRLGLTP